MQRLIPNWQHEIEEQYTNILILGVNGYVLGIEVNAWYIDMQRLIPNWQHKNEEQCTNILILGVNGYVLGIEVNAWYIEHG